MEIHAAYNDPIVIGVRCLSRNALDGRLSVVDLAARKRIADFPVIYRRGMGRCSIGSDTRRCFIGCFQEHGLAAYSTQDGSEIWRRKDLHLLEGVSAFTHEDIVSCLSDEEAFLLCAHTGRTLEILHGIKRFYASPFSNAVLVGARQLEIHAPFGSMLGAVPRTTFGELGCAFSKSQILISESTGPIRCFDLSSAQLLWAYTPSEGSHFLKLCYARQQNCFVGVQYYYKEPADVAHRLFHFDCQTGAVLKEIPLEADSYFEFCMAGTALLSQDLKMINVETGELLPGIK